MERLRYVSDSDIISVEKDEQGNKEIHILGYLYENEEGVQYCEYTFAYINVKDFEGLDRQERFDMVLECEWCSKHYQRTDEHDTMQACFDEAYPECEEYIAIEDISEETECGTYVLK